MFIMIYSWIIFIEPMWKLFGFSLPQGDCHWFLDHSMVNSHLIFVPCMNMLCTLRCILFFAPSLPILDSKLYKISKDVFCINALLFHLQWFIYFSFAYFFIQLITISYQWFTQRECGYSNGCSPSTSLKQQVSLFPSVKWMLILILLLGKCMFICGFIPSQRVLHSFVLQYFVFFAPVDAVLPVGHEVAV